VVLLVAVLIRGGVCIGSLSSLADDPDAYRAISETLATTGVYGIRGDGDSIKATAFRPPLYPYVLSWMVRDGQLTRSAVAWFHGLLGVITVAATFACARHGLRESNVPWPAMLAALGVTIDPILVQQSTLVMTETLATALASIIVWWWMARDQPMPTVGSAIVLGLLLSLAYLCRPTFLVWAALMTVGLWFTTDIPLRRRLLRSGAMASIVGASLLIWTFRNQQVLGHPIWATTHGGYTLLLANNPLFYDHLRSGQWRERWDAEAFLVAHSHRYDGDPTTEAFWTKDWSAPATVIPWESEVVDDRVCYRAARATINREPAMFWWSCVVRVGWLWSPLPHHTEERSPRLVYAVGGYYVVVMLLMLVGIYRLRGAGHWRIWWPAITLAVTLSMVHAVYWSNMRMRSPIIPAICVLAAAAFQPRRETVTAAVHDGYNGAPERG